MIPAPVKEEWWPLEWAENYYRGCPVAAPYGHPTVREIGHEVGKGQFVFHMRKNGEKPYTAKMTGNAVEDELTVRCVLLELAYGLRLTPEGSDG